MATTGTSNREAATMPADLPSSSPASPHKQHPHHIAFHSTNSLDQPDSHSPSIPEEAVSKDVLELRESTTEPGEEHERQIADQPEHYGAYSKAYPFQRRSSTLSMSDSIQEREAKDPEYAKGEAEAVEKGEEEAALASPALQRAKDDAENETEDPEWLADARKSRDEKREKDMQNSMTVKQHLSRCVAM